MVAQVPDLLGSDAYTAPWVTNPPPPPDPMSPTPAPVPFGAKYEPAVERWRPGLMAEFARQGVPTVDSRGNDLIDKSLHVLTYESHGDDTATGDGGAAYGGFQSHYVPKGADMATQIADAVGLIKRNPDMWTDWGEGSTYQGQPFGALGRVPYGSAPPTGSALGGFFGNAIKQAKATVPTSFDSYTPSEQPLSGQAGRPVGGFRDTELQPDPNATTSDPLDLASRGINAIGNGIKTGYDAAANAASSIGPGALMGDSRDQVEDPLASATALQAKAEQLTRDRRLQYLHEQAMKAGGGQIDPKTGKIVPGGFGAAVAGAVVPDNFADIALALEPFKEGIANKSKALIKTGLPEAPAFGTAEYRAGVGGGSPFDAQKQLDAMAAEDAAKAEAYKNAPSARTTGAPASPPAAEVAPPESPVRTPPPEQGGSGLSYDPAKPLRDYPGIKAALAAKEEATLEPGSFFGDQGSLQRKAVGVVNPSVDIPREIHVSNQSRAGVTATERSALGNLEMPAYKKLEAAFEKEQPAFIGDPAHPLKDTWVDYAEHPSLYKASPELTAAKEELRQAQDTVIGHVTSQYGVDVKPFHGADPEAVYVPHMQSREALDQAVARTERSMSSRGTIAKERAYDSLSDRVANDPKFKPETDAGVLADLHSSSLASMAGNNTFKAGAGGKSLTEVMDEVHPGLRDARDKLTARVTAVKAKIDAAESRALQHDAALAPLLKQQAEVESRAVPRMVDLAEADKLTPDLKKMQVQLGELRIRANSLNKAVTRTQGGQAAAALRLNDAQSELGRLTPELNDLRARYHAASPGEYVQNKSTYQYHLPKHSEAIDMLGKRTFDNAALDTAINVGNTARAVGLGPDFSPLTINGALGFFSHPEVGVKNGAELAKAAFTTNEKFIEGLNALDPDLIRRFEFANNRRFGSLSEEVLGSKGFQLPGQPVKKFNEALQRVVDLGTLRAWENDSNLLVKMGEGSQNVADHEAANSISKMIPRLNNAETGRSVQRVALEGALPTSRSFTAQPFSLAIDYTKALTKAATGQELLGREKLALIRGTTMLGTMATVAVSTALISAEANGKSPAEAVKEVIDPNSPRFLSVILGDKGSIPLGGPFRRAFLGVYRTGVEPVRNTLTGERTHSPVGAAAALSYGRNTLQPEAGAGVDFLTNRDWRGQPIRKGDQLHQALQTAELFAKASNLLGGGIAQGAEENGVSGALQGAVVQGAGVNFSERQPYDQLDALSVKQGLGHYADLTPKVKQDFDASPEAAAIIAKKPPTPYQESKAAIEAKEPSIQEARRAEESFKAGTPIDEALPKKWHDEGVARQAVATSLENEFAKTFAGFDKSRFEKAVEGFYQIKKTDTDGNPDFDATESARQDYFNTKLKPDEQTWVDEALQVSRSKKTDLQKGYLDYIDAKKKAGYFEAGANAKELDRAHPEIDLQGWLYGSDVKPDKDGVDRTPTLSTTKAVNDALAMNLAGRPVKMQGLSRPINESPETIAAFKEYGARAQAYIEGYVHDARWAPIWTEERAKHSLSEYGKPYAELAPWQKKATEQWLSSETKSVSRDGAPDLDAYLAWAGDGSRTIAGNQKAVDALQALRKKYGKEKTADGAKPITFR